MKVYSVTMEVKIVVRAESREHALLVATEANRISERLESLRVVKVFCPADGK
jgi:hypothetical protein